MSVGLVATIKEAPESISDRVFRKAPPARLDACWNPEKFACDQIRALVRRVFSLEDPHPVRQVVFSAVGPDIDISDLCQRTGQVLAEEKLRDVAFVAREPWLHSPQLNLPLKHVATQVCRNFWCLPGPEYAGVGAIGSVHGYLAEIRSDFEYSIVFAPPAGESDRALLAAQSADGIVLVLSAQKTRRASAIRVKNTVEEVGVRLLGTVLIDREFPIPEKLYRRL